MSSSENFKLQFKKDGTYYRLTDRRGDGQCQLIIFHDYDIRSLEIPEEPPVLVSNFGSLKEMANWLFGRPHWYSAEPESIPIEIIPLITEEINRLKKKGNLSWEAHADLYRWEDMIFSKRGGEALRQYCGNCKKEIDYDARYPTKICDSCRKKLTDWQGSKVEFFNQGFGGYGCQGFYWGTKQQRKYALDIAYIGQKTFKAQEHYFGGIVISRMG
jgi:hypothetical protein